mmetsp:Transcript_30321/g.70741  ORF Transcript_30321/g.70741 Transcript_30321/m.70741 type:complete len:172 (-) Transcript_30321:1062-1577(-)
MAAELLEVEEEVELDVLLPELVELDVDEEVEEREVVVDELLDVCVDVDVDELDDSVLSTLRPKSSVTVVLLVLDEDDDDTLENVVTVLVELDVVELEVNRGSRHKATRPIAPEPTTGRTSASTRSTFSRTLKIPPSCTPPLGASSGATSKDPSLSRVAKNPTVSSMSMNMA